MRLGPGSAAGCCASTDWNPEPKAPTARPDLRKPRRVHDITASPIASCQTGVPHRGYSNCPRAERAVASDCGPSKTERTSTHSPRALQQATLPLTGRLSAGQGNRNSDTRMRPDGACRVLRAFFSPLRSQLRDSPMLSAAMDFWLLPATLFFDAFLPASKPSAEIMPLTPAARRIRRKRKVIRSKRGD
jgi:hypothetical protein